MVDEIGKDEGGRHRGDPGGGEKPEQRNKDHAAVAMVNTNSKPTALDLA